MDEAETDASIRVYTLLEYLTANLTVWSTKCHVDYNIHTQAKQVLNAYCCLCFYCTCSSYPYLFFATLCKNSQCI